MTDKVSFTSMEHGTQTDYDLLMADGEGKTGEFANRVLDWLRQLDVDSPYHVTRLEHCLQSATRAERDGADDETIVCALLHYIGDLLGPANNSDVGAALLAPYVSEKNHWIVKHHGLFQGYYWFHFIGQNRNAREKYKDHEHYQACVDFCAKWDQPSFDPDYDTLPREHFEPKVRALFAKEPRPFF
ncbi:MAG: phosphohydrolase [Pseudomonadota bacterium]|nr:phosphohydrolase [Pseudomonadota bacterium]